MSNAQTTNTDEHVTLDSLLHFIEHNNPEILKYTYTARSLESRSEGASAWMPPMISAGVNRFPYAMQNLSDTTPMNQAGVVFAINQQIPNPSKVSSKRDYLKSLANIEVSKANWTWNELRTAAKKAYYARVIAEKKIQLLYSSIELLEFIVGNAERRYAQNLSQLKDIYKARAKLEETKNELLSQQSIVSQSSIVINTYLQRDINVKFSIDTQLILKQHLNEPREIDNRSDVNAMRSMIHSMELERAYTSNQLSPDFGIEFEHMQMFAMPNQFSLMGMITIPFAPWSSKMYSAEDESIQLSIQAKRSEIQSMLLDANKMVSELDQRFRNRRRQVETLERDVIPAYEKSFDASMQAFNEGTEDLFELLDSWDMLLMKRMAYLDVVWEATELQSDYEYELEIR